MNTVMITGTAKTLPVKISKSETAMKVQYKVFIWASLENRPIKFICEKDIIINGYEDLWQVAKIAASAYYSDPSLSDGAYTQYLDHIIII